MPPNPVDRPTRSISVHVALAVAIPQRTLLARTFDAAKDAPPSNDGENVPSSPLLKFNGGSNHGRDVPAVAAAVHVAQATRAAGVNLAGVGS